MVINTKKLKGRMSEMGFTQKDIAEYLGITAVTVSLKINNVRPMYVEEAEKIAKILKISGEDFGKYFFSNEVA